MVTHRLPHASVGGVAKLLTAFSVAKSGQRQEAELPIKHGYTGFACKVKIRGQSPEERLEIKEFRITLPVVGRLPLLQ